MFLHLEWWKWIVGIAELLAVYVPMHMGITVRERNRFKIVFAKRHVEEERQQNVADINYRVLEQQNKQLKEMTERNRRISVQLERLQNGERAAREIEHRCVRCSRLFKRAGERNDTCPECLLDLLPAKAASYWKLNSHGRQVRPVHIRKGMAKWIEYGPSPHKGHWIQYDEYWDS